MTAAQKLAHLRTFAPVAAVALSIIVPAVVQLVAPSLGWLAIGSFLALWFGAAASTIYVLFRWRPKCPNCRVERARFVRVEDDEYLACDSCGYREATGYDYRD